ncbi:hypothetical protein KUTeg_021717 [Tegillarca granosa]|uniref:Band 7 domain-containing protein n=1 Tax=Tegillarca granosa TaxID=220873 RepID=A0ABQ9E465_TEGGR|nr:hypothetical protein KUTeg_021717 [Tegillarca granosa]
MPTTKVYVAELNKSYDKDHNHLKMGSENQADQDGGLGCCGCILMGLSILIIIIFFPLSLCSTIKVVQEYERAVIFRLGRVLSGGAKGPVQWCGVEWCGVVWCDVEWCGVLWSGVVWNGVLLCGVLWNGVLWNGVLCCGLFFVFPCVDEFKKVDMRTVAFDVPPQEILTKDSVTVSVDAVVYARVFDATMKDVRLPVQLQRAMAAEAESSREARAKVVAAEGEQKAARALKEAADIITESPAAMQLRYLQTLNGIAAERNSTIIFPLPVDILQGMIKK